jgi:hypothetical protein
MRLASLAGLGRQDAERVGGIGFRDGVFLPFRARPHLVFENVSGQAGGHREWEFHLFLSIRARLLLHERSQGQQWEIVLV